MTSCEELLKLIDYALNKDSLTYAERVDDARQLVKKALGVAQAPSDPLYDSRNPNHGRCGGLITPDAAQPSSGHEARISVLSDALKSISKNTCCDNCREAAMVARSALASYVGLAREPATSLASSTPSEPAQASIELGHMPLALGDAIPVDELIWRLETRGSELNTAAITPNGQLMLKAAFYLRELAVALALSSTERGTGHKTGLKR